MGLVKSKIQSQWLQIPKVTASMSDWPQEGTAVGLLPEDQALHIFLNFRGAFPTCLCLAPFERSISEVVISGKHAHYGALSAPGEAGQKANWALSL